MENIKTFKTPKNVLARMQVVHFGKIMFNMQFLALAIMGASILSFIAYPLYYAVLLVICVFTLFMAFGFIEGFASWWAPTTLNEITVSLAKTWKFTIPIVIAMSLLSIICLRFDKDDKHIGEMIASIVICVLALIYLLIRFVVFKGV